MAHERAVPQLKFSNKRQIQNSKVFGASGRHKSARQNSNFFFHFFIFFNFSFSFIFHFFEFCHFFIFSFFLFFSVFFHFFMFTPFFFYFFLSFSVCGSTFNDGRTRAHVTNTAPASVQSSSQRFGALSLIPSCLGISGHPSGSRQGHPRYTGARSA